MAQSVVWLQAMLAMLNGGESMLEAQSSREDISERPSWDGLAETHGEASSEMAEAAAGALTGVDSSEPSRAALSRGPLSRSASSACKTGWLYWVQGISRYFGQAADRQSGHEGS